MSIPWAPDGWTVLSALQALATPAIAFAGAAIAYGNHRIQKKTRKDNLRDYRLEKFTEVKKAYSDLLSWRQDEMMGHKEHQEDPPEDEEFFKFWSDRMEIHFSKKVITNMRNLHRQSPSSCDNDGFLFITPDFERAFYPDLRPDE